MLWLARGLEVAPIDKQGISLGNTIRRNLGSQSQQLVFLKAFFAHPESELRGDFTYARVYSPDGQTILSAWSDNTARLCKADDGTAIGQPLRHPESVFSVAISPDGRTIATGSPSGAQFVGRDDRPSAGRYHEAP